MLFYCGHNVSFFFGCVFLTFFNFQLFCYCHTDACRFQGNLQNPDQRHNAAWILHFTRKHSCEHHCGSRYHSSAQDRLPPFDYLCIKRSHVPRCVYTSAGISYSTTTFHLWSCIFFFFFFHETNFCSSAT